MSEPATGGGVRCACWPLLLVLALGVLAWDLVVRLNGIPPYVLPGPGLVAGDAGRRLAVLLVVAAGHAGDHVRGLSARGRSAASALRCCSTSRG